MKASRRGRWRGAFWGAVALCAAIACGGRSNGNGPFVGGESHFLYRCVSSCNGGLECISGVCTKPCIVDESDCSALASGALCTNESVEPGAVAICDLACADDGDCSALGGEHGCNLGFCRAPAEPLSTAGTGGAAAGTGGAAAGTGGADAASGQGGTGGSAMAQGAGRGGAGGGGNGGAAGFLAGGGGMAGTIGGSSSVAGQSCETTLIASPEENYQYSSALTPAPPVHVKPDSELLFDWSGVTTDFRGRPVDLDTVDMVEITLWAETPLSFSQKLNDDSLANPVVIMSIDPTNHETSGSILNAMVPAGHLDENTILSYLSIANYPPPNYVYAAMVATGFDYGQGTYMLGMFQLDPNSTNTTVNITSESIQFDYSVSIASRPATYVPPGVGAMTIDWTNLKVNAAEGEFIPSSITELRIASYTESPEELEAEFAHLDEIAVEMYDAPIDAGTKISLDRAKTSDGKPFAGIDATHTWLLALNCGSCQSPAPWYMTVLAPCSASR